MNRFSTIKSMAVVAAMLLLPANSEAAYKKITPGEEWKDTNGTFINAHGGQVVWVDGYYYWFGETRKTSVSCYRSTDLMNWTKLKDALSPSGSKTDENRDIASGRNIERPKVVYCQATGKWVMWAHWENGSDYGQAKVMVAQADKVEGPYTLVDVFRPNGHDSRDQTVFVDADGRGYHFCSTDMNSNTNVALLNDDFLTPSETETKILLGDKYEAAAIFQVGETFFGLFSGCTGWDANAGRLAYTQDIFGTWEHRRDPMQNYSYGENFCVDENAYYTYYSQSTYVFPVHGKPGCYVYMGDRWNSGNVPSSKYVWLPLSVRSGYPTVRWYDSWDMSVFDDMYRFKRLREMHEGAEIVLLEHRSNRIVSRPKSSFVLGEDGESNVTFILHQADSPYRWRLEEKESGKYLESMFGSMRLSNQRDTDSQTWTFELQEDGYYVISNVDDQTCLSLSGNSTLNGSGVYLNERNADIAQRFAVYYDSEAHPDYEEADLFSRAYREENRRKIQEQQEATAIETVKADNQRSQAMSHDVYDLQGRKVQATRPGIYIIDGKKVLVK